MKILNFLRPASTPASRPRNFPASFTDISIRNAVNDCLMSRRMDIVEVEPVEKINYQKLSHRIVQDLCTLQHVVDEQIPREEKKAQAAIEWVAAELEDLGMLTKLTTVSIHVDCERMGVDYGAAEAVLSSAR